jgi:hypothetical protein
VSCPARSTARAWRGRGSGGAGGDAGFVHGGGLGIRNERDGDARVGREKNGDVFEKDSRNSWIGRRE